mgnify:CR=1 FL=1
MTVFYREDSLKPHGLTRLNTPQAQLLAQRPPNLKTTSIAPRPTKNVPPKRTASFAVCAIGKRAEPRIKAMTNIKGI